MRRLNFAFLAVLLATVTVGGGGIYLLHRHQVHRHASAMLAVARQAETQGNLRKAADFLTRYLGLKPDDGPSWAWYARIVDETMTTRARGEDLLAVWEEALRHNLGDREVERRCGEIAMGPGVRRYQDAIRHFNRLLEPIKADPQRACEAAELEDLLGQCHEAAFEVERAESLYGDAIRKDPTRVAAYDRLARLHRGALKRPGEADGEIEAMLKANPRSAPALVSRYRYRKEFGLRADEGDVAKALEMDPGDPDALATAAELAWRKKDLSGARKLIDRGFQRHPARAVFYQLAAGLELGELRFDRAEAVLRRGIAAAADIGELVFQLTDVLLDEAMKGDESKLKGPNGAVSWIDWLRKMGLGDGYLQYFDGRVAMITQAWAEAAERLESARTLLGNDSVLLARINLFLGECYSRRGDEQKRLAAFERAVADPTAAVQARPILARALESEGRLDEAIRVYSDTLESRPESRLDLIRLLIRRNLLLPRHQRDWGVIEEHLGTVEKALPNSGEDVVLLRADLFHDQGNPAAATATLQEAISRHPGSVRLRAGLAMHLQAQNDAPGALKVLDQAAKELGESSHLLIARAAYWSRIGGPASKQALEKIANQCETVPAADQPRILDELASGFYRLGDRSRAGGLWGRLSKLEPWNLEPLCRLADLALAEGDRFALEEAVRRIKQNQGADGTFGRYYEAAFQIGEVSRGNPEKAGSAHKSASDLVNELLERHRGWWGGLVLRGQLAEIAGKPEDAVRDYLEAIEQGAMQPDLARRTVALLYRLNQPEQIDQVVQRLLERGTAPSELKLAAAVNALRRKEYNRAIDLARDAIPDSSQNYFDLLFLSRLLLVAGRTSEAENPLKRALAVAPGVAGVWVSAVEFLVDANRKGEVPGLLERAAHALPKDQATTTLARCEAIAGNTAKAARLFQAAVEAHPNEPTTIRLAADFYLQNVMLDKARPLVAKLLDLKPNASPADVAWANRSRALILISSGDQRQIDRALDLVDQNLKTDPHNVEDQRARAVLLSMKPGRRDDAILSLESLNRGDLLSQADQFLLAQLYVGKQEWQKGRDLMLDLLTRGRRDPDQLATFVALLLDHGDLDQAEQWLGEFKPANAAQKLAFVELGGRLLHARKRDGELLTLLHGHAHEHPDQLVLVAGLFERFGHLGEAEKAYRACADQNTKEPTRILPLVAFLTRRNRTQEAVNLCETASRTCPPEPVAAASIAILSPGKTLTDRDRHRAEALLENAFRRQSNSIPIRLNLAALRTLQQRYDETESIYREILNTRPDDIEALNNLAWMLAFRPGKEQEALELIERAIAIAGPESGLIDTRGVILLQAGNTKRAIQDLQDAVAMAPQSPVLWVHLARALESTHNRGDARRALQRAESLGINPESFDFLERGAVDRLRQSLASRP